MSKFRTVFVAGTMQGATPGFAIRDQGYRDEIGDILRAYNPDIECFDPHQAMQSFIASIGMPLAVGYQKLAETEVVDEAELDSEVGLLREKFRELTAYAAECDLLVAFLPGGVPSMGTAMEMYAAHCGGSVVASITEMRQNLAVLSTSEVIVPDLPAFESWLATKG
ncbi:hypothetical protein ACWDUD_13115 [Rhodococcus sp. NPDC003382]|uniref:hypothetical protein n=1 Tax=Rhodococcus sp. HM1 TaxID=2937759 RepID=UPI00200AEBB9|nr:hypothetical protein [Rhodococcus sp. HM1]MCK8674637.1 hypothetical protein [Rhodococcus sp. HM1]